MSLSSAYFQLAIAFRENNHDLSQIGASHQTGWTGLVAKLIQQLGEYEAQEQEPEIENDKDAIALT
ncbi:MAG: hypothetical protein V7K26_14015 [Nostoc sp.]|uniref:hypothetical protein n=1 Tax=Nostoc sp. TaxID=1180 RepID=UPI002FF00C3F